MMKVFYYYYFLFYSKVLKDNEPHMLTTFALSASEGFFINVILDIFLIKFFCISMDKWTMLGILAGLILANYYYFHRAGKGKEIIKTKPKFFSNHRVSIVITVLFFVITASSLFWGPVYTKHLLEYCGNK